MIKQRFAELAAIAVLVASLEGCTAPQPSQPELDKDPTVLGEFMKLDNKKGNWLNITQEQRLEDFAYLYQTLKENYPYFHVVQRMTGKEMEKVYQEYKEKVKTCDTDSKFFVILDQFTREAEMIGHLSTISPLDYPWFKEAYEELSGDTSEDGERMKRIGETYTNEKTAFCYEKMDEVFWPVFDEVMAYYDNLEEDESQAGSAASAPENQGEPQEFSNVETKILEPGKIAYIKICAFDMAGYEQDKKVLFDFYEQVKDYPHVIFDLTENGGGGMSYFDDLIAAPNIDEVLSTDVYMFMKAGKYNEKFIDFSEFQPISEAPSLPRMNREDFTEFDLYMPITYQIEPLSSGKMLQGKLWMLVSEKVFSSSEYAEMFTKATGFAELVGTTTGGDGIGIDPNPIVLPNSGFLVRYSPIYGVTPDGASSQEFGTEPDITSPEGQSPLDTCLREIAERG